MVPLPRLPSPVDVFCCVVLFGTSDQVVNQITSRVGMQHSWPQANWEAGLPA